MAHPVTIKGKVLEVQGSRLKVQYGGDLAANVGDPCEIGFELGGDFAVIEGQWKIVEVGPDFAWAHAEVVGAGMG